MRVMADPMWALLMFDLPTKTVLQRKRYTQFRNLLLDNGFVRTQYSVYSRYSPSGVLTQRLVSTIKAGVPEGGEVRILHVTDKEWATMIRFFNASEVPPEPAPDQLMFF